MAKPKTTSIREVTSCTNCPFAVVQGAYCSLHPARIDITNSLQGATLLAQLEAPTAPYPLACPLKRQGCMVRLKYYVGGRPRKGQAAGRDLDKEAAHLLAYKAKHCPNGWGMAATEFCEDFPWSNRYGPPLPSIHHFRKAITGKGPFWEVELDKLVAYAKDQLSYPGYTPPGIDETANTILNNF